MSGHHCPRRKATARRALVGNLATVAAPMVRDSCVFSARPAATTTLIRACNSREQPAHHTQPPFAALLDAVATRSHHLCTSTSRKIHHCSTTHGLQQPPRLAAVRLFPSRHHRRDLIVNNIPVVARTSNHHCHTKTARAVQHHCDIATTRRSSRASSSLCVPLPEPPFSNQPRRHSLRRPHSLPRHRRHTSQQE
ncbi:hypothetical protein DEO72_LG2g2639 [Vigna unguiculata]|uniref:Uncharacterized protein n=1 Tax=Vigna unguiculata TaxID=3917 RepID=A0A4D6L1E1_VIGUN|nr:hypothetical protein DEO72_LG2g2639 [Vigna unguiculata]